MRTFDWEDAHLHLLYLSEHVEDLKNKPWLKTALKSHLTSYLIRTGKYHTRWHVEEAVNYLFKGE